jgi:nucleosome binding factor SPN SPT16 subunit
MAQVSHSWLRDETSTNFLNDLVFHLNSSCDIVFYEMAHNILWKKVLKEIRSDLQVFYEDGGWRNLSSDAEGDDDDNDDGASSGGEEEEKGETKDEKSSSSSSKAKPKGKGKAKKKKKAKRT